MSPEINYNNHHKTVQKKELRALDTNLIPQKADEAKDSGVVLAGSYFIPRASCEAVFGMIMRLAQGLWAARGQEPQDKP